MAKKQTRKGNIKQPIVSFGDRLYRLISQSRNFLFVQGETAQLTYQSFVSYITEIQKSSTNDITIKYPLGYRADNTTIEGTATYTKDVLIERYNFLANIQLPINSVYQMVTVMESLLGSVLKEILLAFPNKIPSKKKLDFEVVLKAESLEEIKLSTVNIILNELAYKSPKDYAEEFERFTGINLLEFPSFHKYIELKATRDIYIHNNGVANEIYKAKAGTLARVEPGVFLPINLHYFLQSYESCIQTTESLEKELDKIWPSLEYQNFKRQSLSSQKGDALQDAIDQVEDNQKTDN
ncbi:MULTISPECIES: hypothetical protein [Sphingobacterium]|uniref:hypothetical protein n=1 Tax=Sphingobacterium TaxID=28453 RepID=UPI0028AD9B06|nr:hypothetical protein [Sphingobacterium multivorum]